MLVVMRVLVLKYDANAHTSSLLPAMPLPGHGIVHHSVLTRCPALREPAPCTAGSAVFARGSRLCAGQSACDAAYNFLNIDIPATN